MILLFRGLHFCPFLFRSHLFIGNVLLKCIPVLQVPVEVSKVSKPFCDSEVPLLQTHNTSVSHKHTTSCLVIICVYSSLFLGIMFLLLKAVVLKVWSQSHTSASPSLGIVRDGNSQALPLAYWTLRVELSNLLFYQPSMWFWWVLKFENHSFRASTFYG